MDVGPDARNARCQAVALLVAFLVIESRVPAPLMPLEHLEGPATVASANATGALLWLRCSPGSSCPRSTSSACSGTARSSSDSAFLPATILWGVSSLLLSDKLVNRFGIKPPLLVGLACYLLALLFLTRPVDGKYLIGRVPGMLVLGIGEGISGFHEPGSCWPR